MTGPSDARPAPPKRGTALRLHRALARIWIADLTEELDDALYTGTSLLQKQIKYGLTDRVAIAFHEAGFADRYVASTLGLVWGDVVDRDGVRAACQQEEIVRAVLSQIPSYFVGVAAELGGWA